MDLTNSCLSSCCLDCTRLLAPVTGVPLLTMTLSKLHSAKLLVPVVGDKPHHPIDFAFPSREFGKKNPTKCSFQARWFKQWKWIHYSEENDSSYYFYCVKAYKENKLNNIPTGNLEKIP